MIFYNQETPETPESGEEMPSTDMPGTETTENEPAGEEAETGEEI